MTVYVKIYIVYSMRCTMDPTAEDSTRVAITAMREEHVFALCDLVELAGGVIAPDAVMSSSMALFKQFKLVDDASGRPLTSTIKVMREERLLDPS
jgi:hypothetical protein